MRNKALCFVIGFVSSVLWAYSSYAFYNLKWDAGLNLFYAVMSVYGWFAWRRGGHNATELPITALPLRLQGYCILIVIIATAAMTWSGLTVLNTSLPLWDSLTTVLSVLGTFLLTRRMIDAWLYLLIADLVYIGIYASSGAFLFMVMMIIYSVMAVVGWYRWQRMMSRV